MKNIITKWEQRVPKTMREIEMAEASPKHKMRGIGCPNCDKRKKKGAKDDTL